MFDRNQFFIGAALVFLLMGIIRTLVWHFNKRADQHTQILHSLKGQLVGYGIILTAIWLFLPSTYDLKLYAHVNELKSLEEVNAYLIKQSNAMDRLEMVHWFLFMFMLTFLGDLYKFAKLILEAKANTDNSVL